MVFSKKYHICLLVTENHPHSACFLEVALLLKHTLKLLGISCDISINKMDPTSTNILLGSNLLHFSTFSYSGKYIVYQLEQLSDKEGWYTDTLKKVLENAILIWDYSQQNIKFLSSKGIHALYLPLGYHPSLEMISQKRNKDINILFYGSINKRRQSILNSILAHRESKLQVVYGVYGKKRDLLIERSKIILNIHYYSTNIFESVRIFYLLHNRCFIISEESSEYPYKGVEMCLVPYDKIIETSFYYKNHLEKIDSIRALTYNQFKELYPMKKLLKEVLM